MTNKRDNADASGTRIENKDSDFYNEFKQSNDEQNGTKSKTEYHSANFISLDEEVSPNKIFTTAPDH